MTRRKSGAARKRQSGEGSVYQRADGRWVGSLTVGHRDGKRLRRYIYGASPEEVRDALTRARNDLLDGHEVRTDQRETVAAFLTRWLEAVKPTVRPGTWVGYEIHVRLHLLPNLGSVRLTALSTADVQIALNRLAASGLAPKTVRHVRATLRLALNAAMEWNLVKRNAAARGVKLPPMPKSQIRVLSEQECQRLLDAARDDRLHALYATAAGMGLRQGELLGLSWSDIDLDRGVLHVRHSLRRIGGRLVLAPTKTEGSAATVPMPEVVIAGLRAHGARQELDRRIAGDAWQDSGLVFTTGIGTAIDARNLQRHFASLLRQAGLPRVRFHDLRHSFASILLARGANFHEVASLLRHSSPALVASTYGHVMPDRPKVVIGYMDAALGAEVGS